MDKLSYALGMGIGHQLAQMNVNCLSIEDLTLAIKHVIDGNKTLMTSREAQDLAQNFFANKEKELQEKRRKEGNTAKEIGENFLVENAKKEGVMVRSSGLQYLILKEGNGKKPTAFDKVKCHYEGFLTDGTLFDSSIQRGEPAVFGLQQVISGWTEGLQLMKEGAKFRFFIPYRLGYGEAGAGGLIPPYATLIFDVELIEVM